MKSGTGKGRAAHARTHKDRVAVEKKCPMKCDETWPHFLQKAKEKCDNRKIQLEKKYKNMTAGYESILFLLAWYSISNYTIHCYPFSISLVTVLAFSVSAA